MNNQDQNQLPMLPDPLEDQSVSISASAATPTPVVATSGASQKPHRNYWRMGLIFGGVLAVLAAILFGSRITELLNLRGTKAGESVGVAGTAFVGATDWFEKDNSGNKHDAEDGRVLFEVKNGKLVLTNLATID